jgi:hypothetical protein
LSFAIGTLGVYLRRHLQNPRENGIYFLCWHS